MNPRLPKIIFVALAVYAIIYFSFYYKRLPQILASHFNVRGQPNGWESKPVFFAVFAGALGIAALIGFGGPLLIKALPPELINLPQKERWLNPDFREATLDFLDGFFAWFGCGVLLLLMLTFNYAMQSNLDPAHPPDPSRFCYYLAGFGIFALVLTARFVARFSGPPKGKPRNTA